MKYNNLGSLSCSYLGLGYMRYHNKTQKEINEMVDFAIRKGINYFESCYFYLDNQCEKIVANSLKKYNREDYILCAKMPVQGVLEQKSPEQIFSEQLSNLQTDYFDVYLLQALDKRCFKILNDTKAIQFLIQKRREGKIKKLGFSFHDTADIFEKYLKLYDWDCCQLQLNYYDWYLGEAKKLYELSEKYGVPVIVMGPTKGGTLIRNLPKEAKKYLNCSPIEACFNFLYELKNVKVILTGAEEIHQLEENIDIINKIEYYYNVPNYERIIELYKSCNYLKCSNCKYCEPHCAKTIPLGEIFTLYNNILKDTKDEKSLIQYRKIQKSNHSSFLCQGCGNCERFCPQHLPIRKILNENIFPLRL